MNRKMPQYCGIKQYAQEEKLQQIAQIGYIIIKNKIYKSHILIDVAIHMTEMCKRKRKRR
jgi:hypothetical protein